ncbi:MAG: hypothetical protein GY938_13335 [Ketobacter sp.]|nr:hypothetical protein [Ketobacter sp.]
MMKATNLNKSGQTPLRCPALNLVEWLMAKPDVNESYHTSLEKHQPRNQRKKPPIWLPRGVSSSNGDSVRHYRPPADNGSGQTSITKGVQRVIHRLSTTLKGVGVFERKEVYRKGSLNAATLRAACDLLAKQTATRDKNTVTDRCV